MKLSICDSPFCWLHALNDHAILVISGPDGVQSHTRTLWQLLEYYKAPTFIFVNKTDISIKLKEDTEAELARALSPSCVAFLEAQTKSELDEKLALTNERLLETYLSGAPVSDMDIASLIAKRRLFPFLFGSALRTDGIEFLLRVLDKYTLEPEYDEELFGAKVYKIARAGADRLTYMKLTGGCLTVRDELSYSALDGSLVSEKVNRIRLYSGDKFEQTDTVCAGEICAVCGLSSTYVGQGLGFESDTRKPVLEPVLSYRIILPEHADPVMCFPKLKELEEEEPSLHLVWNGDLREIEARLMGDIQTDLLKRMIFERFSLSCEFDAGKILYKE